MLQVIISFIIKIKTKNKERLFIKNEILRCLEGARLAKQEPVAIVESIGANINSNNEEYNIIPSVNFADKFYFSAIREDNEEVEEIIMGLLT